MNPQNAGIQTLLEAEKEAAKTVAKARQYRVQRLKDAKSEAQKEIDALKSQKEAEFKKFLETLSTTEAVDKINKETEQKIQTIKQSYKQNQDNVMQKILEAVVRVDPVVHQNLTSSS